jgi:hypothetical protein
VNHRSREKLERAAFLGKAISLKDEAQGMATSALDMMDERSCKP